MRKQALLILLAAATAASCVQVQVRTGETPHGGAGLAPGDRVVARWQDTFWEATVFSVDGTLVTIVWDQPPPDRSYVPRGWVERLDARGGKLAIGAWRLCRRDAPGPRTWAPCRVHELTEQGAVFTELTATRRLLKAAETLPVPTGLREWVETYGTQAIDDAERSSKLASLRPDSTGEAVTVGETVLARWEGGGWWEATVVKVDPAQIVVAWKDGSDPTAVLPSEVAPIRPARLGPQDSGICRRKDTTKWSPARVEQASGELLAVSYDDGTPGTLRYGDCVRGLVADALSLPR